jgi:branched-chain amino acid transport system permease protein
LVALFAIYLIINLSLNLQLGYAGIPNFGLVLAVTGGAYTVGWLPIRLCMWIFNIDSQLGADIVKNNALIVSQINSNIQAQPLIGLAVFALTLIVAVAVGSVLGFISAYPAIRLRTDYLAITLLALGEVLSIIGQNYDPLVGGVIGILVPDVWSWSGDSRFTVVSLVLILAAMGTLFILELIARSPISRTFRAIRDNEVAASAMGKNVTKVRMEALVIGSMICSLAGALYAFYVCYVGPAAYGRLEWTFLPWLMVIFGGLGNNFGVVLGTFIFIALEKLIVFYKYAFAFLPFDVIWLEYLLLGSIILVILIFRPSGLMKEKPSQTMPETKLEEIVRKSGKE